MIICLDELISRLQPKTASMFYQPNNIPISVGDYFQFSNDYARFPEFTQPDQPWFITYKNTLAVSDFANLCYFLPQLAGFQGQWLRRIPLFTRQAGLLPQAGQLALEGGPCIFGTDEVYLYAQRLSGEPCSFDLNILFGQIRDAEQAAALFADLRLPSITFKQQKLGISAQEYEFFDCLFQFASLLGAPLMISIPDMSYLKFFNNLLAGLEDKQRLNVLEAYAAVIYEITQIYLSFIERFQVHYRLPRMEVLHQHNSGLLELFYQARQPFLKTKNLTSCSLRLDSIADYVSLPALPFYLWGIRDIIEVNSTDETDSIRKCMHNHRRETRFYPVMIPEKVNKRGDATVFESRSEDKGYVLLEEVVFKK